MKNIENLLQNWLEHPETLGAEAIEKLPRYIDLYPYCESFRLLYTIALANTHSMKLNDELRVTAALVPNRSKLFQLVNKGEHEWVSLLQQFEQQRREELMQKEETDDFALIDQYLSQQYLPDNDLNQLMAETSVATFNMDDLEKLPDATIDEDDLIVENKTGENASEDDLIDQFLEADSHGELFVPQPLSAEVELPITEPEKIHEKAFLTESLAKLYVKQHKFEQALAIFSSLNLKYSKNSSNFADQIRYLEKVIAYRKEQDLTENEK